MSIKKLNMNIKKTNDIGVSFDLIDIATKATTN